MAMVLCAEMPEFNALFPVFLKLAEGKKDLLYETLVLFTAIDPAADYYTQEVEGCHRALQGQVTAQATFSNLTIISNT